MFGIIYAIFDAITRMFLRILSHPLLKPLITAMILFWAVGLAVDLLKYTLPVSYWMIFVAASVIAWLRYRKVYGAMGGMTRTKIRNIKNKEDLNKAMELINESAKSDINRIVEQLNNRVKGHNKVKWHTGKLINARLAIKRAKNNIPPQCAFFVGSTGVGKTELVKAVGDDVLKKAFISFNCTEYKSEIDSSKLFGSGEGFINNEKGGRLANAVRQLKASNGGVILFDEIEKMNKELIQGLLSILSEGRIEDTQGVATLPKNSFIFFTSNQSQSECSDIAEKYIDADTPESNKQEQGELKELLKASGKFSPEFMSRINLIAAFGKLEQKHVLEIVVSLIKSEAEQYGINVDRISSEASAFLTKRSYSASGVRGIKDYLRSSITEQLINMQSAGVRNITVNLDDENKIDVKPYFEEAEA